MINEQLQKKIDRAIKLLKSIAPADGSPVEVAYSGGKDSDVILQLTKESGIAHRAIYKCTTIDPPGTIAHAKEMGAEIMKPKKYTFRELIIKKGLPSRFHRFCCSELKEYKVLDKSIIGIRKSESSKRAARYNEPTECRFYGSNKDHVESIYPILDWTDEDVRDFIIDRNIKCAPVYYDGGVHFTQKEDLAVYAARCRAKESEFLSLRNIRKWLHFIVMRFVDFESYIRKVPHAILISQQKSNLLEMCSIQIQRTGQLTNLEYLQTISITNNSLKSILISNYNANNK